MAYYVYLVILGILEIVSLSIARGISLGRISEQWIGLSMIMSSFLPFVFLMLLLSTEITLPSANLIWDLSSGIIIILIGLYYFDDRITHKQSIGILTAILALFLLN
jgi:multidrug transporter EmrE-like cation transporter